MAHIVTDRVQETTTTTGTGAITLGGAVANFQDFDSQMANADTTAYAIVHRTANEWEVGLGTWNTGNTLTRTTVIRSTNGNAAVNFSAGTKDIFMTFTPSVRVPGMSFTGAPVPATNDLAALGSASLSWADLFLASGGVINWGNGEILLTATSADLLSLAGADLSLATDLTVNGLTNVSGPTASRPSIFFSPGTLMTTPSDGAMEVDATNFYGTTDAGNRGILPVVHFIRANATRTFTSNTNSQAIFNSPANGRLTIETGTYLFRGVLSYSAMSATSGNRSFNILGAGTATLGGVVYTVAGADTAVATVAAGGFSHNVAVGSTTSAVPATTAVGAIQVPMGSFECTVAGTIIPSTTMVTAAASTLAIGSFLEIWRIGTDAVVSVGQWD